MDFIRRFIEQRISRATGEAVRFGKLTVSPLSGSVDIRDMTVGNFLSVKRIQASIAIARALKQEIVVRSLTIESPAITVVRSAEGKLNIPARPARPERSTTAETGKEPGKTWEFEAQKVLIVAGRAQFEDASGYRLSLENVTGSIEMKANDATEFAFAAQSLGRRDRVLELGEAQLLGKVSAGAYFTLSAMNLLDLQANTLAIDSGKWNGALNLSMNLPTLLALLPAAIKLPISHATGDVKFSAIGSVDVAARTLSLEKMELRSGAVTLG